MPIISKTTWDKFTQDEKDKISGHYKWFNNLPGDDSNCAGILILEYLFGKENLQPQPLTYEDIEKALADDDFEEFNEKLKAIERLMIVAKFLNKNEDGTPWKPDWEKVQEGEEEIYGLGIDPPNNNEIKVFQFNRVRITTEIVYFRTEELSKQAVTILGEETVRLALSSDW